MQILGSGVSNNAVRLRHRLDERRNSTLNPLENAIRAQIAADR